MPNSASSLQGKSYEKLFQMFVNAVSSIIREKQVEAAKELIISIQEEWRRRRRCGDPFVDFERPEMGMLAVLGYRVGHTEGKPRSIRREILKYVLHGELPMVKSVSYTDEWGEPNSDKRCHKLVRVLQNEIEGNRSRPASKFAVSEWIEDLAWVEQYWLSSHESLPFVRLG